MTCHIWKTFYLFQKPLWVKRSIQYTLEYGVLVKLNTILDWPRTFQSWNVPKFKGHIEFNLSLWLFVSDDYADFIENFLLLKANWWLKLVFFLVIIQVKVNFIIFVVNQKLFFGYNNWLNETQKSTVNGNWKTKLLNEVPFSVARNGAYTMFLQ